MTNQLTPDDVKRIAELAHLQLSDEETELFTRQLGDILRYAERLPVSYTHLTLPTKA